MNKKGISLTSPLLLFLYFFIIVLFFLGIVFVGTYYDTDYTGNYDWSCSEDIVDKLCSEAIIGGEMLGFATIPNEQYLTISALCVGDKSLDNNLINIALTEDMFSECRVWWRK